MRTHRAPKDVLRDYVVENGLKFTKQRALIVDVFLNADGHLRVEDLLALVRERNSRVSLATVYRTIKLLTDCGLALPHRFEDRQTLYEPVVGHDHHDHIICLDCNEIIEFVDPRIEELQVEVTGARNFRLSSHRMELYAYCERPNCPNRNRPKPAKSTS